MKERMSRNRRREMKKNDEEKDNNNFKYRAFWLIWSLLVTS
ncbi:hypothetical protein RS022_06610 [Candidatus Phytoplasma rubi]|uniref:Uncharacterized protein n=1 Tax=Candidatus Phytoplasma rubi TaxID=399025 RepID=A0ABY7BS98_9MOLU|nr:hypothetical protein RS022_06610 [Candidatus Phytoplasma rubi]